MHFSDGMGKGKYTLNIALIGCGRVAEKHLKGILFQEKKGRGKLVAVADSRKEAAEKLLRKYKKENIPIFQNQDDLLAALSPDIVAITTPSGSHKELALKALNAGVHLLIEKPLAMTLEDALAIRDMAEKTRRKVALGHIYRYLPTVQLLYEAIGSGRYGRVLYSSVDVRWGHGQDYYDLAPWRGTRKADGGVIMNQSVHALDLMRWLIHSETSKIVEVKGFADLQNHQIESEDLGLGLFAFANGSYLNYEGSTSTEDDLHEARLFICCEKADIRAGLLGKKYQLSVRAFGREERNQYVKAYAKELVAKEGLIGLSTITNPHTAIYSDLIAAIQEDKIPLASVHSGVSSLEMVEALYEASGII